MAYDNPALFSDPIGAWPDAGQVPFPVDEEYFAGLYDKYYTYTPPGHFSNWADKFRSGVFGDGLSDWTLIAGNLIINYGALPDGIHHITFSNGHVSDYGWAPDLNTPLMTATEAENYKILTSMGIHTSLRKERTLAQRNKNGDYVQIGISGKVYVAYTDILYWDYLKNQNNSKHAGSQTDIWNSLPARILVPDIISIGVGFTGTAGTGTETSFELNWIIRGQDASLIPVLTTTITPGVCYQTDATINIGGYRYLGVVNGLKKEYLKTTIGKSRAGIFSSIGGDMLGKLGFTASWTPTPNGYGLIQTEVNVGVGLLPGPNGSVGFTNTFMLWSQE